MGKYYKNPNIVGMRTKFDQKMHDKYDIPARKRIIELLGDYVIENPNIYKQDLIITNKKSKYKYLELQVCTSWIDEIYPFKQPFVYARKCLYEDDTIYLTLNKSMTKGFLFDRKSFRKSKPRRLRKYSREFVYDIPWCQVITLYLDNLDEDLIELY